MKKSAVIMLLIAGFSVPSQAGLERFKDYFDKKTKQVENKFDSMVDSIKKTAVKVGETIDQKAKRIEDVYKEKSMEFADKIVNLATTESGFSLDELVKGSLLLNKDFANLTKAKEELSQAVSALQASIKPILDLAAQIKADALAIKGDIIATEKDPDFKNSIEASKIYADVVASLVKKGLGYQGKNQGVMKILNSYDTMITMLGQVDFAPVTRAVNGVFDNLNQLLGRVAFVWQSMGDFGKQFESAEVSRNLGSLKSDIETLKKYSNNLLTQKFFTSSLRSQDLIRVLVIGVFQDVKQAVQTGSMTSFASEIKISQVLNDVKRDLATITVLAPMIKNFLDNAKTKFGTFTTKTKTAKQDWMDRVKKEIASNPLKNAILAPKIAVNQLKVTFDALRKDLVDAVKSLNPVGLAMAELASDGSQIIHAVDQWVGTGKFIQPAALKNVEGWFAAITAIINDLNNVVKNIDLVFSRE